jgi:hypothetical protein
MINPPRHAAYSCITDKQDRNTAIGRLALHTKIENIMGCAAVTHNGYFQWIAMCICAKQIHAYLGKDNIDRSFLKLGNLVVWIESAV